MNKPETGKASFRADINGLRAWAVVAVVFYHFGLPGFGGGFIGVDVFFVISGFLMTGIIVKALEEGRFSLAGFYAARARRIVPALLVLCAVLLALGWWLLLSPEYKTLGTHIAYSLSFLSNVEYWQEAGYFDSASQEKWLLHTWSLSVEWQFYMLLPIVLWAAWHIRSGRRLQRQVVGACLLVSLALCISITATVPDKAFFMLHTRAWEMLAGGLVFLCARPDALSARWHRGLQYTGLLLILLAIALLDKHSVWPGWRALLPVSAAMLILAVDRSTLWLTNGALQWIGNRSYSIYLWHWPVLVSLAYTERQNQYPAIFIGLLLTLLAGHLSYLLVEVPARRWSERQSAMTGRALIVACALIVLLPAVAVWRMNGVTGRFPQAYESVAAEADNFNPRREACYSMREHPFPSCLHGGTVRRVIGIGDSHLSATVSALAQARPDPADGIVEWSYRGCVFAPGLKPQTMAGFKKTSGISCAEFTDQVLQQLATVPANIPVVVMGRYANLVFNPIGNEVKGGAVVPTLPAAPALLEELSDTIVSSACALATKRTVYMVRPLPEMPMNVPKTLSHRLTMGRSGDLSVPMALYRQRNAWVWRAQDKARDRCGVRILDPLPYLCGVDRCDGSRGGRPLYFDDNHLSEYGNKLLVPMFSEVFRPG